VLREVSTEKVTVPEQLHRELGRNDPELDSGALRTLAFGSLRLGCVWKSAL